MDDDSDQRRRILAALARGDGQTLDGFDLGHTAEVMYGSQADAIALLVAAETRRWAKAFASELDRIASQTRHLPGDSIRRRTLVDAASRMRVAAKALTKAAQECADRQRAEAVSAGRLFLTNLRRDAAGDVRACDGHALAAALAPTEEKA